MMRLREWWLDVRASLWFVPGQIVLAAVVLAIGLVELDVRVGSRGLSRWPLLFGAGAAGSRGLLTAVATSMITVAGVVFSITVVALSLTASQYTSRVLRSFMSNRTNQAVLGVFVGIFAYCLVVLRTIRGGDEGVFVPSLAVLFGLLLAFVGIGVLIYFIHHIASSIQASHILATVADETLQAVDRLFPDEVADPAAGEESPTLRSDARTWHVIPASRTGYLQGVYSDKLVALAQERGSVVRMECSIGEFLIEGAPLAALLEPAPPDEAAVGRLQASYRVGRQRTIDQDAAFGVRQIVDIALKALSPGINDTTTAVMCLDYLTAILSRLSARRISQHARGEDGELRVLARTPTFDGLVREAFDQIRESAAGNTVALDRMIRSLDLLTERNAAPERRRALLRQVQALTDMTRRSVEYAVDRERLEQLAAGLTDRLIRPADKTASSAG
jgi:uncharacterized membrane protein